MHIDLVDKDAVLRFKSAVDRLLLDGGQRILLAVSGGPDSLAMLLLAHAAFPEQIAAATVDHGLRPEAADEARFVASICATLNVTHVILTPNRPITGNVQSAARVARYALLEQAADELQCDVIATAHHSDDQLETVLMRVARGSGINGLAAIRARNGRIIRPLLEFSKSELEQICEWATISPVRDPSNDDGDFDRVAMRQYLAASPHPFDAGRSVRTASALADAAAALDWMTQELAADRIKPDGSNLAVEYDGLPLEIQRRLVIKAMQMINPDIAPRGDALDRLFEDLRAGRTATLGNILCKGGEIWHFSPAPPRRSVKVTTC